MKISRTRFQGIFLATALLTSSAAIPSANAAPKPGASCSKVGVTQTASNKKFTCVKSGKKLVWKIETSKQVIFKNLCDPDPLVPAEWADIQKWGTKYHSCTPALRYLPAPTNFTQPSGFFTPINEMLSTDNCKIRNTSIPYPLRGFPLKPQFEPTKRANIQILATSFKNHPAQGNPMIEHKREIDLFLNVLKNISDVPIKPTLNTVTKYKQLPNNVEDYKLYVHQPDTTTYQNDVIAAWDSEINFSEVDYVLIFAPTTVYIEDFNRAINFKPFVTAEKTINSVMVAGPLLLMEGTNKNSQYANNTNAYQLGYLQETMIHEGIYHLMGLDDHFADESYRDPRKPNPTDPSLLGTGSWGNMSGLQGELLTWDKWTTNLIYDSQVHCVDGSKITTHWIHPSSSRGVFTKLVVVPLTTTKAVVIESRRSTGYNFKFPLPTEGALVYSVDTADSRFGYGMTVYRPATRVGDRFFMGVLLGDATLKRGESITVEGIKVSVSNSGEFGDVVKVERAN